MDIRRRLFPTHLLIWTPSESNTSKSSRTIPASSSFHFRLTSRQYRYSAYLRSIHSPNSLVSSQIAHIFPSPRSTSWLVLGVASLVFPRINPIAKIRKELNVPNILPWTDERTPREYLYSSTDRGVRSSAVEEHIAEAKEKGLAVREEKFVGSSHVAHVRKDPTKYWNAIEAVWVEALKSHKFWFEF